MALILCLDDDATVARMVADVVRFCKHDAVVETSSIDAVATWLKNPRLKGVFADFMMPRLDGVEFLTIFRDARPDVRRILITAAPGEKAVREAEEDGTVQAVIAKPPSIGDIKLVLVGL